MNTIASTNLRRERRRDVERSGALASDRVVFGSVIMVMQVYPQVDLGDEPVLSVNF
jgi:hypothetical protein